jgi:medium-chain acyl-[acyl-carrier-protein] hydrolase
MFLPVLRADFELVETYCDPGGEPFDFPITAFGGIGDTEILQEDLEGWSQQTTANFRLRMFPGGHFYINTHRAALLEALSLALSA